MGYAPRALRLPVNGLAVAILILIASSRLIAGPLLTPIASTFDSNADGWVAIDNGASLGTFIGSGGSPGGFFKIGDANQFGADKFKANAPAKFLNSISAYDGGTFSFDVYVFSSGTFDNSGFGTVRLIGPGGTASLDFAAANPAAHVWTTYSKPFAAADWGVSQATWSAILADVDSFTIELEAMSGDDSAGVDNVTLTPEPTASLLLAIAGPFLMRRKRLSSR